MPKNRYEWLIELFHDGQSVGPSDAELLGKAEWLRQLKDERALASSGNQRRILCPHCDIPHDILIDPVSFEGYCQDSGPVKVEPETVVNYVADHAWLVDKLRAALEISASTACRECLPDGLWMIGESRVGGKMVPVYLARCDIETLGEHFKSHPGNSTGVVFLTFPHQRARDLPGGHRHISLAEIMGSEDGRFTIDRTLLERIWQGTDGDEEALAHDPEYKTVTYLGQSHIFRGKQQRKVVQYLIEQHKAGNPVVVTSEMMSRLQMDSTRQIPHLFRGHRTWDQLISYGDPHGTCRIRAA